MRLKSQGEKVRPRASTAVVAFSNGADRSLARLDGERGALSLTWKGKSLPKPRLAGAKATYRGVEAGVDLAVEARPQGFDQKVVVNGARKRPLVLRFGLALRGLKARLTSDGRLELRDRRGRQVVLADPARMSGAQVGRDSQEPLKQARVATRLSEQDGQQVIKLRPDPKFLASAAGRSRSTPAQT